MYPHLFFAVTYVNSIISAKSKEAIAMPMTNPIEEDGILYNTENGIKVIVAGKLHELGEH